MLHKPTSKSKTDPPLSPRINAYNQGGGAIIEVDEGVKRLRKKGGSGKKGRGKGMEEAVEISRITPVVPRTDDAYGSPDESPGRGEYDDGIEKTREENEINENETANNKTTDQ